MFSLNMLKERYLIVYGLTDDEITRLNSRFVSGCKRKPLVIEKHMENYTLSALMGSEEYEVEGAKLPEEKVIIFNGFQGVYLQQGVKKVRDVLGKEPILASTTPNSVKMKISELFAHLMAERQYFKNKS